MRLQTFNENIPRNTRRDTDDLRPLRFSAGAVSRRPLWLQFVVLSGFVCSSHVAVKKKKKKCVWIISSDILAFSPTLKDWGVPQGWCLILAPFVSSVLVWENPVRCDLCCPSSSHSVQKLQQNPLTSWFENLWCHSFYFNYSCWKKSDF